MIKWRGGSKRGIEESLYIQIIKFIINRLRCQNKHNPQNRMSVSSMTVGGKIKFKIVLLGDQHVGKSSIIDRFINDKFQETYNATIGIDFLVRNITHENKTYRLQLWDTAGQERFRALIPSYLKDSHCALIVYDIGDPRSLENAARWLEFYSEHKQAHSVSALIGNKNDLQKTQNCCTQKQIEQISKKLKVPSYKISAKSGQGITELFHSIIDNINESLKQQTLKLIQQRKEQQNAGTASVVITKQQPNIKLQGVEDAVHKELHQIKKPCCS